LEVSLLSVDLLAETPDHSIYILFASYARSYLGKGIFTRKDNVYAIEWGKGNKLTSSLNYAGRG